MGILKFPVGSAVLGVVKSTGTVKPCLRGEREKQGKAKMEKFRFYEGFFFLFAFCFQWIPRPLGTILALGHFHPALISAQADSGLPEEVSFHSQ